MRKKREIAYELEEGAGVEAQKNKNNHFPCGIDLSQDEVTVHEGEEQTPESVRIAVEHYRITETGTSSEEAARFA